VPAPRKPRLRIYRPVAGSAPGPRAPCRRVHAGVAVYAGGVGEENWDQPLRRESQPAGEWDPAWDPADALSDPVPRSRAGRVSVLIIAAVIMTVLLALLCVVGTKLAKQYVDNDVLSAAASGVFPSMYR
jgi:hypothetical protein